jgi:hypothetical protein
MDDKIVVLIILFFNTLLAYFYRGWDFALFILVVSISIGSAVLFKINLIFFEYPFSPKIYRFLLPLLSLVLLYLIIKK